MVRIGGKGMTTKLEQEFYDTFGIEKQKYYACQSYKDYSDVFEVKYPPITDKIILELIIIYLQINNLYKYYPSIEDLKNDILKEFIARGKNKIIKHQIQQLFDIEEINK